ncbi:MAG: site-specific integrase [Gammaproteobacteria bacterium]
MSRRVRPPRLWLRPAEYDAEGRLTHAATWIIKDGQYRRSTGCREEDGGEAQKRLAEYIAGKHVASANAGIRAPADIPVADVIALYTSDVAEKHSRPKETAARLDRLLGFFGNKMLSDINGDLCREYARKRGNAAARREMSDLRAAINHHRREGLCSAVVELVLPRAGDSRERWLTRTEAAKLIRSAWRYREIQKGHPTGRYSRRHVARFILVALYTTRRKGAILSAALSPAEGRPWADLDRGVLYGAPGARRSKKRQPAIALPLRLLGHLRRWKKKGQRFLIEFNGAPIGSIDKAFGATVDAAKLDAAVIPHALRHTGITWLAIEGVDPYEICRYAGITMEVFERVYAHHHPDFMRGVHRGFNRSRRDRQERSGREQSEMNVLKIPDSSMIAK